MPTLGKKTATKAAAKKTSKPATKANVKKAAAENAGAKSEPMVGPKPGSKAPDFKLPDQDGKTVQLSKLKGKPVVVYFYPKDDTSGCTVEAKDFTCLAKDFAKAGVTVLGISPDSVTSHHKFIAKHELGITLLADEAKAACEAYAVWVEKSMYGRRYMGVERATFLIDKAGKIAEIWRKVKVPGHADAVLAAAKALS